MEAAGGVASPHPDCTDGDLRLGREPVALRDADVVPLITSFAVTGTEPGKETFALYAGPPVRS